MPIILSQEKSFYFILCIVKSQVITIIGEECRDLFRISRSWVPLMNKSQKIVGALVGAPILDLKNRGCLAPLAPTLKRTLEGASLHVASSQFYLSHQYLLSGMSDRSPYG